MTKVDKVDNGLGNTISSPLVLNKKKFQCRRWVFTLNSYDVDKVDRIFTVLEDNSTRGIIGKEIAPSTNTRHLQGYLEFENSKTMGGVLKLFMDEKPHVEPAKASPDDNYKYCSKENNFHAWGRWPEPLKDPLKGKTLHKFQTDIIELCNTEPDDRTIHWYWEPLGCKGKTSLAKHLAITKNALIVSGKAADIKCAIAQMKNYPKIVIFCIPRTLEDFMSYDALESVKDGLFFNGKYESGMVVMNCPHVIVFANFPPRLEKLSMDRWKIHQIMEEQKDHDDWLNF